MLPGILADNFVPWSSNSFLYNQAINYPTVPRGQEKLRISPTPHHTVEMMDRFIEDMVDIWKSVGLPLKRNKCGSV